MQKLSRLLLHQRNDKAGTSHNFAFDTLTKVYRDAVYTPQSRYSGNPMYPEWSNPSEVTSHVGGLGVMSETAAAFHKADAEAKAQGKATGGVSLENESHGHSHQHGHDHGHEHGQSYGVTSGEAKDHGGGEGGSALERLRTAHARSKAKKIPPRAVGATFGSDTNSDASSASPSMRHSGVQVEVLGIYRQMLKETRRMQDPSTRVNLQAYIRDEFDKSAAIPRKQISKIEWQINYGKRKLEELQGMSPRTKFSICR